MKKNISTGFILLANVCVLLLSALLLSCSPGLLNRSMYIDRQTYFRMFCVYGILFLFIATMLWTLKQSGNGRYRTMLKLEEHFFLILYTLGMVFVLFIATEYLMTYVNWIPFRTVFSKAYDFIVIPDEFGVYSLFRTILFYILYPIPFFTAVKIIFGKMDRRHYWSFALLFFLGVEVLSYIVHHNFDIDHILLGLYGVYLVDSFRVFSLSTLLWKKQKNR